MLTQKCRPSDVIRMTADDDEMEIETLAKTVLCDVTHPRPRLYMKYTFQAARYFSKDIRFHFLQIFTRSKKEENQF